MKSIRILQTKVNLLTIDQLHNKLTEFIKSDKKAIVDYLNIYSANLAVENKWFADFLNLCDIVLCDGKGIQLSAFLLKQKVPQQIPYNRWLWEFFSFCEEKQYSIFFLGSKPGVVDKTIENIKNKGYNIVMNGHHGYFKKEGDENVKVIETINKLKPDFLIVGFGMPLQEKWLIENHELINAKVTILGGAYLDWISGDVKVPPQIVSKIGIEWFYRLVLEPQRLAGRYLVGIPQFFFRIMKQKINNGVYR